MQDTVVDVFAGIDLRLREDTKSAVELISKNHFDGFIIDCDGMEDGKNIVAGVRTSRANRQSVIFTIVDGTTSVGAATELGSNFVLGKSVEASGGVLALGHSEDGSGAPQVFPYQLTLDAEALLWFRNHACTCRLRPRNVSTLRTRRS